nr:hypothetical protein ISGA_08100 [Gordonia sp. NB41Y]
MAPTIRTESPAVKPACVTSASCSVISPTGSEAASVKSRTVGDRDDQARIADRGVGEGADGDAHDRGARGQVRAQQAAVLDHPGHLHTRGERSVALGVGGIGALEGVEIGPVDPGGHHPDPERAELFGRCDVLADPVRALPADECTHGVTRFRRRRRTPGVGSVRQVTE